MWVMRDRASVSMVEQVILSPPLLENRDMTSWQKKSEMCRELGSGGWSGPPGDRIRHKNCAKIPPIRRLCPAIHTCPFSWVLRWLGFFSNIWSLLNGTQEQPFPSLCALSPSPSAVPRVGPVDVTKENNLSDHPQSIILWHQANVIPGYVMG